MEDLDKWIIEKFLGQNLKMWKSQPDALLVQKTVH